MKTGTRILIAFLLLSTIPALAAPPAKKSKIWLAYERAERFGQMGNLVYKANVDARWVGDTHQFWYRNDVRGKSEWVLSTPNRQAHRLPGRIQTPQVHHPSRAHPPRSRPRRQTPPPAQPDTGKSPDGNFVATIKDHNILLQPKDGAAKPLTTNGTDKIAYARINWSPDSKRLVAWKTEFGDNLPMYTVESAPADSLRPSSTPTSTRCRAISSTPTPWSSSTPPPAKSPRPRPTLSPTATSPTSAGCRTASRSHSSRPTAPTSVSG